MEVSKPTYDELLHRVAFLEKEITQIGEKLKYSEEYNRVLFNQSKIAQVVMSVKNWKYIDCNLAAVKIYGYTTIDEVLSLSPLLVSFPVQYDGSDSSIASKVQIDKCLQDGFTTFEWKHQRPNGEVWDAEVQMMKFNYKNDTFLLFNLIDITRKKKIEQDILIKTQELEQYFNYTLDLLCIADNDGYFRKLNPEWSKTLGYPLEELLNKKFIDYVHPDDITATLRKLSDLNNETTVLNFINRYLHKNGSYRWIEWRSFPVGKSIYAVARDITDRINIEQSLRQNQQRLDIFIKNLPVIAFAIDKDGIFTLSEGLGLKSLGLNPGEFVGLSAYDVYRENQVILRDVKKTLQDEPAHNITPIGDMVYEAWYSPVHDADNQVVGLVGVAIDITDRKKAESDLIESEEKFRTLFENITEGVALHEVVYNQQGDAIDYVLTNVNPAYKIHTGIGDEVVGRKGTAVYGTLSPPYIEEFSRVAKTRIPYFFETYFQPLGKHFLISVVSPKQGQFATVFEDITERIKREEELRTKNEELARFIYTVSHDLKSPLVTIKAFTSYLVEDIEGRNDEAISKDMGFIQNAADKMGILLEELLELSRIGRKDNPKKEIPLVEIVNPVIELLAGRITNAHVCIDICKENVILYGDQQRLLQLFQNLIDNAVKFMGKQQEPRIEIGVNGEGSDIVFFVKDNGMGIDARYKHKLFGLFEKLDTGTEGTGIGLALVKRIVETHGGKIWFESDGVDKGTTFYFTLENAKLQ